MPTAWVVATEHELACPGCGRDYRHHGRIITPHALVRFFEREPDLVRIEWASSGQSGRPMRKMLMVHCRGCDRIHELVITRRGIAMLTSRPCRLQWSPHA